jgi:hypothetical protein
MIKHTHPEVVTHLDTETLIHRVSMSVSDSRERQ